MAMKRPLIAAGAILACLMFAWATGAGRPYPATAGGVIDPTCTSSLPCIEYDNNGTGPGIRGISVAGNGLAGATKNNSTSPASGREGLIGNDISTSGIYNAGVRGLSVRGTGVEGQSSGGNGVNGLSTSGSGVVGISNTGFGVVGINHGGGATAAGVQGDNSRSTIAVRANGFGGPLFVGNNSVGVDVFTADDFGNLKITGDFEASNAGLDGPLGVSTSLEVGSGSIQSIGVHAHGTTYGVDAIGVNNAGVVGEAASGTAVAVEGFGFGADIIEGINSGLSRVFSVDDAGNTHAHSFTADLASANGQHLGAYAPQASEPVIEDFGEGQLSNGSAYVHLESRFASVMARGNYLVFITPEGDNRGLYVTLKSPEGFAVRESQGGHSSIAFDYRLVAKPLGAQQPRLPMLTMRRVPRPLPVTPRLIIPKPHVVPKLRA
jgi:hypothetical protein